MGEEVGAEVGEGVGALLGAVVFGVGTGVGKGQIPVPDPDPCVSTPQGGVSPAHIVPENAEVISTLECRHQPKSWLKAEA